MKYNPDIHHRRSIRLQGYDYSQAGAYFVTICARNRECLCGEIMDGKIALNELGEIVEFTWVDLPNHNAHIALDAFMVMPNHVHGIIALVGAGSEPARTMTTTTKRHGLSEIVRQFKTFSSKRINEYRNTIGVPVWQRNYYEYIIRNENELNSIREYIINNPLRWDEDEENPTVRKGKEAIGKKTALPLKN